MKRFVFRLEKLRKLRKQQEFIAEARVFRVRRQVRLALDTLTVLIEEMRQLGDQMGMACRPAGHSESTNMSLIEHSQQIQEEITRAQETLLAARKNAQQAMLELAASQRKVKVLDNLFERQRSMHQSDADMELLREQDDAALREWIK